MMIVMNNQQLLYCPKAFSRQATFYLGLTFAIGLQIERYGWPYGALMAKFYPTIKKTPLNN